MSEDQIETAFPIVHPDGGVQYWGLSIRDYFAAAIATGAVANPRYQGTPKENANFCYEMADAMLIVGRKA